MSKSLQPMRSSKRAARPVFMLGLFRHPVVVDHFCYCGRAATHLATALVHGTIVTLPICEGHQVPS